MIPEFYRQRYSNFQTQVRQVLVMAAPLGGVAGPLAAALKTAIAQLQQNFQSDILGSYDAEGLENQDLDLRMVQRLRSLQVEIDRQLRLLAMDALFLQTARQATTVQQRQQQISDRLEQVDRYCAIVLAGTENRLEGAEAGEAAGPDSSG
jgi:hypothetical protein